MSYFGYPDPDTPLEAQQATSSSQPICTPDAVPPKSHMADALSSLFASGKYSDLVIKCRGQRWKVHRAVVCMQSKPIGAAIDGGFIEASTGEFIFEEDNPRAVQLMLKYMYTGMLDIEVPAPPIPKRDPKVQTDNPSGYAFTQCSCYPSPLQIAGPPNWNPNFNSSYTIPVYGQGIGNAAGNIYQSQQNVMNPMNRMFNVSSQPQIIPSTQVSVNNNTLGTSSNPIYVGPNSNFPISDTRSSSTAAEELAKESSKGLLSAAEVYVLADKYDVSPLKVLACDRYKALCDQFWNSEEFIESLSIVFDGTPDTQEKDILRVVAFDTAAAHAKELLTKESFQELCQDRGDITTALLMASVEKPSHRMNNAAVSNYGQFDSFDWSRYS